jgi:GT2 family glycosyltransferase
MSEPRAGTPDLSVVIVSWNTRELLDRCLASVFAASGSLSCEVCVVDNASIDGSAAMVAERWPQVTLIRNAENRGYAPACNQGLRGARGRFVLALNTDAFPIGSAVETLARRLESDPGLGAVGPRLLNPDGSTQRVCARRSPGFLSSLVSHTVLPSYVPALARWSSLAYPPDRYERPGDADVLSGACLMFRREALERAGYLDDALVLNYDDVEWCLRARRAGYRLGYEPAAEVTHLGGQSRAFDSDTTTPLGIASIFAFWDLAFSAPQAALLKLAVMASLAMSLTKNLVLASVVSGRHPRLALLVRLMRCSFDHLLHPRPSRAGAHG